MVAELINRFILAKDLDRAGMIERAMEAHRQARSAAERNRGAWLLGEQDARSWAEAQRVGRLLFYLRFGKLPSGTSSEEIALLNGLGEELQRREARPVRHGAALVPRRQQERSMGRK